jgi:phage shock protein A
MAAAGGDDDGYLWAQLAGLDTAITAAQVDKAQVETEVHRLEQQLQQLASQREQLVASNSGAMERLRALNDSLEVGGSTTALLPVVSKTVRVDSSV